MGGETGGVCFIFVFVFRTSLLRPSAVFCPKQAARFCGIFSLFSTKSIRCLRVWVSGWVVTNSGRVVASLSTRSVSTLNWERFTTPDRNIDNRDVFCGFFLWAITVWIRPWVASSFWFKPIDLETYIFIITLLFFIFFLEFFLEFFLVFFLDIFLLVTLKMFPKFEAIRNPISPFANVVVVVVGIFQQ